MPPKRKTENPKSATAEDILKAAIASGEVRRITRSKLFPDEESAVPSAPVAVPSPAKKVTAKRGAKREREESSEPEDKVAPAPKISSSENKKAQGKKESHRKEDQVKTEPANKDADPENKVIIDMTQFAGTKKALGENKSTASAKTKKSAVSKNGIVKTEDAKKPTADDEDPEDRVIINMTQFAEAKVALQRTATELEDAKKKAVKPTGKSQEKAAASKKEKCALCDLWNTEWEFCGKTGKRHASMDIADAAVVTAAA